MKKFALLLIAVMTAGCSAVGYPAGKYQEKKTEQTALAESGAPLPFSDSDDSLWISASAMESVRAETALVQEDTDTWTLNGDMPFFGEELIRRDQKGMIQSFEEYRDLDEAGRTTGAVACLGRDLMPESDREDISSVKPSGWLQARYESVSGGYLYNRCHLIAYCLSGENANAENLMTGTRQMNEAMIPFETSTARYLESSGSHVLYRVTPVYQNDNLLADGIVLEIYSVEDQGRSLCMCRYIPNKQDGIEIDYADGTSWIADEDTETWTFQAEESGESDLQDEEEKHTVPAYIGNRKSGKFHLKNCRGALKMSADNQVLFSAREEALNAGMEPCGICKP